MVEGGDEVKPIDQTRLHDPTHQNPPGNCFQACVASILELPIEEVPDEADDWELGCSPTRTWRKYWLRFAEWLQGNGVGYFEAVIDSAQFDPSTILNVPMIACGPSPRDRSISHAVVMQWERVGNMSYAPRLLHDPHPSREGLAGEPETIGFFVC